MNVLIKCGFQAVDISCFRKKSLSKGNKLLQSCYVSNVTEEIIDDKRILSGSVIRETPGATSTKRKENLYFPKVKVNEIRKIEDASCTYKAGKCYCKHAAAICLFVNAENTLSKTDQPMIWNKPSEVQLQKYHKGCTIESLFCSDLTNEEPKKSYNFSGVVNISENHMLETSMQVNMIQAEEKHASEVVEDVLLRENRVAETRSFINKLFSLQNKDDYKLYSCYDCELTSNTVDKINRIKLAKTAYATNYPEKYGKVKVTEEEAMDIALHSINQSQSSLWYKQRFFRITCSSKAHRIKTRQENFEGLACQFPKEKYNGSLNMKYGLKMEPEAVNCFKELTGYAVKEIGLVISLKQLHLACSPDGIVLHDDCSELLEVECPYSCVNNSIINISDKTSMVPYLEFMENGNVELKQSHQ